jgi:hypothetical protein
MSAKRIKAVGKAVVALAGITGCLGGLAYAATEHGSGDGRPASAEPAMAGAFASRSRPAPGRPPRPMITKHPAKTALSVNARFAFTGRRAAGFQCRLDGGSWKACQDSIVFRRLAVGAHSFAVRTLDRSGARSSAARFTWTLAEPKGFSIAPQLSGMGALYPGAPPTALPLVLTNPNGAPILVTSLRVTVTGDAPGCDSAGNLLLFPSSASPSAPIRIPARGSVSLPAAGISPPSIQLRDLPVSQDACRGAHFPLAFSGEARG